MSVTPEDIESMDKQECEYQAYRKKKAKELKTHIDNFINLDVYINDNPDGHDFISRKKHFVENIVQDVLFEYLIRIREY